MKNLAYLLLTTCVTAAGGCVSEPDLDGDGIDDRFFDDGKGDTGGIADGSPEALAVLRVANERTETEMADHGVPPLAAQNIVAVRRGDDLTSNTDDVLFTTLSHLDAVPYVGPQAFARLLAYADELGYLSSMPMPTTASPTDLWNIAACPPITLAQLVAKFPAGGGFHDFQQPYTTASRHRLTCNPVTGCTPWQAGGARLWVHDSPHYPVEMPSTTRGSATMILYVTPPEVIINFAHDTSDTDAHDFGFQCHGIDDTGGPIRCSVRDGLMHVPVGFTHEYSDRLSIDGRICADGSYHFTSSVLGDQSDAPQNLNQIALYGRLF